MILDKSILDNQNKLYLELIWLNITMRVARKLIDFPWVELNLMDKYKNFANISFKNNFEYSIIIIRKIYYDNGKDCLTLPKFKNQLNKVLKTGDQKLLKRELKQSENFLKSFENVINSLRNERFAHKIDPVINGQPKDYSLTFNQLESIVENLNEYFKAIGRIAFNTDFEFMPWDYQEKYNRGVKTDVEQVLDLIGFESDRIRLKEEKPEIWDTFIGRWTKNGKLKKHLNAINYYRKKLSLEEIYN